jgi:hypothetical protein
LIFAFAFRNFAAPASLIFPERRASLFSRPTGPRTRESETVAILARRAERRNGLFKPVIK